MPNPEPKETTVIRIRDIVISTLLLGLAACASDGSFDSGKAAEFGVGVLAAGSLDEKTVKEMSAEASREMDAKHQVADQSNPYAVRLRRIVRDLENHEGMQL